MIGIPNEWQLHQKRVIIENNGDKIGRWLSKCFVKFEGFEGFVNRLKLNLTAEDLKTYVSAHMVMNDRFSNGLNSLEKEIQRMPTKLVMEPELFEGEVRGHVDWVQTVQNRSSTGNHLLFLCLPPSRSKDTFLAKAMYLLYRRMKEILYWVDENLKGTNSKTEGSLSFNVNKFKIISEEIEITKAFNEVSRIESVNSRGIHDLRQLPEPAPMIADALEYIQEGCNIRNENDLKEIINDIILTYGSPDNVFELLCGSEIINSLFRLGFSPVSDGWSLAPTGLLAQFEKEGVTIELWAQTSLKVAMNTSSLWDNEEPNSRYSDFRTGSGYSKSSLLPDHLLIMKYKEELRIMMIEEKMYKNHKIGVRAGLKGVMAYIFDAQDWLVKYSQFSTKGMVIAYEEDTYNDREGFVDNMEIFITNQDNNRIKMAIELWACIAT